MAATITHEINSPLEAMMNLMYLLRPMIADPAGISYSSQSKRNSDVSRISPSRHLVITANMQCQGVHQSGRSFCMQSRSMSHCVQLAALRLRKRLIQTRKIVLRCGEMMQVVSNLMMNSIYAMQAGGVLSISVEDAVGAPDGIVLTIQDNGVGITESDLPRVFEAFFTTRSTVGTGIGLFVAKQFGKVTNKEILDSIK
jgi:signal transduction histidine kinase